jgi:hypothetical protein
MPEAHVPARARAAAPEYLKTSVPRLPNYANNLLELGYTEADMAGGCSDPEAYWLF